MNYPNKTYVLETVNVTEFSKETIKRKHVVIVVADSIGTAHEHIKEKLGFKGHVNDLVWLMGCNHPTIYTSNGAVPKNVQAKIMYNSVTLIK